MSIFGQEQEKHEILLNEAYFDITNLTAGQCYTIQAIVQNISSNPIRECTSKLQKKKSNIFIYVDIFSVQMCMLLWTMCSKCDSSRKILHATLACWNFNENRNRNAFVNKILCLKRDINLEIRDLMILRQK